MAENDLNDLAARVDAAIDSGDAQAISGFLEEIERAIQTCDANAAAPLDDLLKQ